jgi:hypothetical protein
MLVWYHLVWGRTVEGGEKRVDRDEDCLLVREISAYASV